MGFALLPTFPELDHVNSACVKLQALNDVGKLLHIRQVVAFRAANKATKIIRYN